MAPGDPNGEDREKKSSLRDFRKRFNRVSSKEFDASVMLKGRCVDPSEGWSRNEIERAIDLHP